MSDSEPSRCLEPFGMRAVSLGLVTVGQVEKALAVQKMLDKNGQHQLIGAVMVDLEMMTTSEQLAVLRSYEKEKSADP